MEITNLNLNPTTKPNIQGQKHGICNKKLEIKLHFSNT
jgi:hypothetical protein